ncbi:MAG: hypothetical protein WBO46_25330 [Caldilineaceae bacterium]
MKIRVIPIFVPFLLLLGACVPAAPVPATATPTVAPTAAATAAVAATDDTPAVGLTLTWQDGDNCTTALLQPESGVQTGPCNGQPTNYPFSTDTPDAAALLTRFVTAYAPFTAETPIGTVKLNSTGTTRATPAQQRQMAETARWLIETAMAGRSSAANYLALSWHREGGIAGFCDDLAISTTGLAQATTCKGTAPVVTLSDAQLGQLYTWLDTLQAFDATQDDPVGVADAMHISLRFGGRGAVPADAPQQQAILDFASALFAGQGGAASPTGAASVVDAFLAALQADPSGQTSLGYLSSDLQAEVAGGKPVAALVGVQNLIPTYSLAEVKEGSPEGQAVVAATLNYTSPYGLHFYLTQGNGTWQISRIEPAVSAVYQPLAAQECGDLRDAVASALGVEATLGTADFSDFVSGQTGSGCLVTVTGTGEDFSSFLDVADKLQQMLTERGWVVDTAYLADGPTGTATGLRLDHKLALLSVGWQPSADAHCPADKIITDCGLTPAQQVYTITLNSAESTAQ